MFWFNYEPSLLSRIFVEADLKLLLVSHFNKLTSYVKLHDHFKLMLQANPQQGLQTHLWTCINLSFMIESYWNLNFLRLVEFFTTKTWEIWSQMTFDLRMQ
jgi:hypothetical protein